ncbi:MAG: hypothetical protein AB8F65_00515 [Woeseiaceae bacterium]
MTRHHDGGYERVSAIADEIQQRTCIAGKKPGSFLINCVSVVRRAVNGSTLRENSSD